MAVSMHTDEDILEMMHLRENEGFTMQMVADRVGVGRNSVIGLVNRVNNQANKHSDNQDGTMPPRWWRR
ncbi:MAG: hypothetical protein ACPG4X_16380 [Pikeienuella sp.]